MAARSLNKATLIGNLTRNPELRYTANGTPIVTFGVATNREYTPSNQTESIEDTEFHNIVAWSKLAELCEKLLAKGQKVYIEGRLQTRNWVDEDSGKKMYRTEVVAEEMIVLSPPKDSYAAASEVNDADPVAVTKEEGSTPKEGGDTDEIPF